MTPIKPEELEKKAAEWWNGLNRASKQYEVWMNEGGTIPVAALSVGAIIRLYMKSVLRFDRAEALELYHKVFK